MSLAAVAQRDFSRAFLNQVELGRSRASPRTLRIIAERLGRPVEYFLQDEPDQLRAAQTEYTLAEAEVALLKREPGTVLKLLDSGTLANMPLTQRMRGMLYRGEALVHLSRGAEAMEILAEPVKHFDRAGPPALLVRALDALGGAYWVSHRLEEALSAYERARQTYDRDHLQEPELLARIMGHIAVIHQEAGRHGEAIGALEAGLAATEHLLDLSRRAVIYEGLASSYYRSGDGAAALEYITKALRIFEQLQQLQVVAQVQHNMAEILVSLERTADAANLYRKAVESARRAEAFTLIPLSLAALAELALGQQAVDEAARLADEAIAEARHLGVPRALAAALRVRALVAHWQQDWPASDAAFEEAIREYEAAGRYDYLAKAHGDYAACLRERGELARAAEHFERAYQIRSGEGRAQPAKPSAAMSSSA